MKPIVIYVNSERDEIKLSRKQFEKIIQDAYQQGYDSGYAEGNKRYYWYPYTYNSNSQSPAITYTTGTDPNAYVNTRTGQNYNGQISLDLTGEAHNSIGD